MDAFSNGLATFLWGLVLFSLLWGLWGLPRAILGRSRAVSWLNLWVRWRRQRPSWHRYANYEQQVGLETAYRQFHHDMAFWRARRPVRKSSRAV